MLAIGCLEAGLFSRAKIQIQKATTLDPQLVKDIREGEVREGIAKRVLGWAKARLRSWVRLLKRIATVEALPSACRPTLRQRPSAP